VNATGSEITLPVDQGVFRVFRDVPVPPERTIVIFGAARSGTSMVASIAHDLGIATNHTTPTFEDRVLGRAADAGDWPRVKRAIERRNSAHQAWAWKRPRLTEYFDTVRPWLRNPRLIATFKNPMGISRRKEATRQDGYLEALIVATSTARRTAVMCSKSDLPLLIINHDAALLDPALCVSAVASFVGVTDPEVIAHALGRMTTNRDQYLRRREIVEARLAAAAERGDG
jgi:hypothetical protein